MKVFLFANNSVGLDVCRFLIEQGEEIVGLGIHNPATQKYTEEIIQASKVRKEHIILASTLRQPNVLNMIKSLDAEIGISAFWDTIFKPSLFTLFPRGCVNFHPAYLPYNRGKNPNVWPFIEKTPAGVTIHYIDEQIDTGDIIDRRQIKIEETDTAGILDKKTQIEIVDLFKKIWPTLKKGTQVRTPQENDKATFHWGKEVDDLDEIKLNQTYTGRELIDRLRARSYDKRSFAYYVKDGEKIYLNLSLHKTSQHD